MMTAPANRKPLAEWLQAAYADDSGCPAPEAYLEAVEGILPADKMAELSAHADHCPACNAERQLADQFLAGEDSAAPAPEDVAYVVSRLEARFGNPAQQPAATADRRSGVLRFPGRFRVQDWQFRNWAQLAAALILVVGLGSVYRSLGPGAPVLPSSGPGEVIRGTSIDVLAPVGEVAGLPDQLRWRPVAGAVAYQVNLTTVAGTTLLDESVTLPEVLLLPTVQSQMRPNSVYYWQVQAIGVDGSLLAWSGRMEFRFE